MKYNHPTEIPRSKALFFDWVADRISSPKAKSGDTHPITWGADGDIYVGAGDPGWYLDNGALRYIDWTNDGWKGDDELVNRTVGAVFDKITGEPEEFEVHRVNDMYGFTGGGGSGAKPSGLISVGGKLYYALHNLLGMKKSRFRSCQHGSDATIICSEDYGKTWTPELNDMLIRFNAEHYDWSIINNKTKPEQRESFEGWKPMFPGNLFGGLSFVQFGKDNADAVDEYVYAVSADQWDNGRDIRLGRVRNDSIMDRSAWEFYVGAGWTKKLEESKPILEIDRHISMPEMVYIKSMQKYITLTWAFHTDFRTHTGSELTILESDNPWGPFELVHYEWMWHDRKVCPYVARMPLKWFNPETREGYILFSGNFEAANSHYGPHLQKFKFSDRTGDEWPWSYDVVM